MSDVASTLLVDLLLLSTCTAALFLYGRISALHPAPTYLFFHAWAVTLRLTAIASGSTAGLRRVVRIPPSLDAVIHAARAYDLALVAVTLIWLYLAQRECTDVGLGGAPDVHRRTIQLSLSHFRAVAAFSIVVGLASLWYLRFSGAGLVAEHQLALGEWSRSTWVLMTTAWAVQGFAMLHYVRGFPPGLTTLTVMVFVLTVLGNSARYVLVVWFLFCLFTYLSRRGKKWPTLPIMVLTALVAVVWFPLKTLVASYWAGDDLQTSLSNARRYVELTLGPRGNGGDTTFLDQNAMYIELVDQHGSYFYGRTLAGLILLPIPRPWWPDKPSVTEWVKEISTPERPVKDIGWVPGIVGEGYANFGYLGVALFPMIAAYIYGVGYYHTMQYPHNSIQRFTYILCACMLVQVFRDGLASAYVFTLVLAMPMVVVVASHWLLLPIGRRKVEGLAWGRSAVVGGSHHVLWRVGDLHRFRRIASRRIGDQDAHARS